MSTASAGAAPPPSTRTVYVPGGTTADTEASIPVATSAEVDPDRGLMVTPPPNPTGVSAISRLGLVAAGLAVTVMVDCCVTLIEKTSTSQRVVMIPVVTDEVLRGCVLLSG